MRGRDARGDELGTQPVVERRLRNVGASYTPCRAEESEKPNGVDWAKLLKAMGVGISNGIIVANPVGPWPVANEVLKNATPGRTCATTLASQSTSNSAASFLERRTSMPPFDFLRQDHDRHAGAPRTLEARHEACPTAPSPRPLGRDLRRATIPESDKGAHETARAEPQTALGEHIDAWSG